MHALPYIILIMPYKFTHAQLHQLTIFSLLHTNNKVSPQITNQSSISPLKYTHEFHHLTPIFTYKSLAISLIDTRKITIPNLYLNST